MELNILPPIAAIVARSKKDNSAPGILQYPSNIGSHAMNFSFVKYNRKKTRAEQKIVDTVILPVPQELNEVYGASYQDAQLGLIGGEGLQTAMAVGEMYESISSADNKLQAASEAGGRIVDKIGDLSAGGMLGMVARRALAGVSSELGGAVDLAKGNVPNPHAALLFNGVNLRSHSFSWRFSPTNSKDEDNMNEILRKFKVHMLPKARGITDSGAGDSLLTYPDEVDVSFLGSNSGLFRMKRCVITDLVINQSPEGTSFHAGTGNPVFYSVQMTLREVEIMTRDDFDHESGVGLGTTEFST